MIYDYLPKINLGVILEAGANTGSDTRRMSNMFPDAVIYACEPIPQLYQGLLRAFSGDQNIKVVNTALSDYNGYTSFYTAIKGNEGFGSSSMLKAHPNYTVYLDSEEKITVACTTIPDLMDAHNIPNIDFLWLDIEMMEYRVLKAAKSVLHKIKYIYTELSYSNFRVGQADPDKIHFFLTENGFTRLFIEPQGSDALDWQANTLYKHG